MVFLSHCTRLDVFSFNRGDFTVEGSVQFSSVAQLCPTLCDPMNYSMPGLPVHHHLPELTQTHVYRLSDAIQQSHPLPSPSPPAFNLSQHQGLFKWVSIYSSPWGPFSFFASSNLFSLFSPLLIHIPACTQLLTFVQPSIYPETDLQTLLYGNKNQIQVLLR